MREMISTERVTAVCKQYGLTPGQAMDIKNGYDLDLAVERKKAWESILRDKPQLVIGSPPCTCFSSLQELNKHMYRINAAWMANIQDNFGQAKRCEMLRENIQASAWRREICLA